MNKRLTSLPTIYPAEIAQKGEEFYQSIKAELEKNHFGEFVAIDVQTREYFLGKTQIEALRKAKRKFPASIFYFVKVGFAGVISVSSHHQPITYGSIF